MGKEKIIGIEATPKGLITSKSVVKEDGQQNHNKVLLFTKPLEDANYSCKNLQAIHFNEVVVENLSLSKRELKKIFDFNRLRSEIYHIREVNEGELVFISKKGLVPIIQRSIAQTFSDASMKAFKQHQMGKAALTAKFALSAAPSNQPDIHFSPLRILYSALVKLDKQKQARKEVFNHLKKNKP